MSWGDVDTGPPGKVVERVFALKVRDPFGRRQGSCETESAGDLADDNPRRRPRGAPADQPASPGDAALLLRRARRAGRGLPAKPAVIPAPTPGNTAGQAPKLAIADSPELAEKLAREKKQADDEKMRIEPEEKRVTYNSYGRRDPFIPVEAGSTDNGIDIDQMKVVGIIWQASEPLAVLEHVREANVSFTIKQGDPVHNGRVARITRESVTFDISEYGISRSYSLKLVSSKEGAKK